TLVNAGDFSVTTLPLVFPVSGAPRIAGRGPVILVPGGAHDSLQILVLGGSSKVVAVGRPVGVAFQDDTLAWVTDSAFDAVVQVNVRTAQKVVSPAVSSGPVEAAVTDSQVFSAHSSWLAAIKLTGIPAPDSIPLSGTNAHFMVVGDDSLLYVIERGDSGKANGRVSVVDPVARQEIVVINGLGERPGAGVYHPTGRILIASATEGILEINSLTRSVIRGPGAGIKPDGHGVVALSLDNRGRVYAVAATACGGSPGTLYILSPPPDYRIITT